MADIDPIDVSHLPYGIGIILTVAGLVGGLFLRGTVYGKSSKVDYESAAADKALLAESVKRVAALEKELADERAGRKADHDTATELADDLRDQRDKFRLAAEVLGVRLGIDNPDLPPMPESKLAIVTDAPRKRPIRRERN